MSFQTPRKLATGDIITAADWNAVVDAVAYSGPDYEPTPAPAAAPGVTGLLALAVVASATRKPISRRALLGLWRREP